MKKECPRLERINRIMYRVLHVVDSMGMGGIQAFIMNVYRTINKDEYQFDFLLNRHIENSYEKEIAELGGIIYFVPSRRKGILKNCRALNDFFMNHQGYIAIHMHESSLSYIEPLIQAKKNGCYTIIHSHSTGVNNSIIHRILHEINKKRIYKYANCCIACGELAREWMYGHTKVFDQSVIITNGIDIKKYTYDNEIREKYRKEFELEGKYVIGHVGRFSKVKNHDFLIDVFAEVLKIRNDAILMLVGDGTLRNKVDEKVNNLGLNENVLCLGARKDISNILQAIDVLVLPSFYEGFPVTVVEAEAAGVPVVMSDAITDEVMNKSNIIKLSLKESTSKWAEKICEHHNRAIDNSLLYEAGLDITETTKKLIQIYARNGGR